MPRLDDPPKPWLWGSGRWSLPGCSPRRVSLRLGPQGCVNAAQLYFGAGSKLTVLGKEGSWGP